MLMKRIRLSSCCGFMTMGRRQKHTRELRQLYAFDPGKYQYHRLGPFKSSSFSFRKWKQSSFRNKTVSNLYLCCIFISSERLSSILMLIDQFSLQNNLRCNSNSQNRTFLRFFDTSNSFYKIHAQLFSFYS